MAIRLTDILKKSKLREAENKSELKYDLKSMGGGYSDGTDVAPGKGPSAGKILISSTLYGGGSKEWLPFPVPEKIQEYITAYEQAQATGDPLANDIEINLNAYYTLLKKEIGKNLIMLLQNFDRQAKEAITNSVQTVNRRYGLQSQPEKKKINRPEEQSTEPEQKV